MPLKPMFSRAPLTMQPLAPLAPEAIALEGSAREMLEKLCALALQAPMGPALAEGALTCAYLCENAPLAEKVEQWLRVQLNAQGADGSLPLPAAEGIRVMLAVARLFAHQGEKTLLEPMMRYCACLRERWEELRLDGSVMGQAANLMELLLFLYNVTGKKALLHLMELTRRDAMDWSGLMSTFALSRPTAKLMPLEEMTAAGKPRETTPAVFTPGSIWLPSGLRWHRAFVCRCLWDCIPAAPGIWMPVIRAMKRSCAITAQPRVLSPLTCTWQAEALRRPCPAGRREKPRGAWPGCGR